MLASVLTDVALAACGVVGALVARAVGAVHDILENGQVVPVFVYQGQDFLLEVCIRVTRWRDILGKVIRDV